MKRCFLIIILGLCWVGSYSQFNIKVGYTTMYSSLEATNNLFKIYNDRNEFLEDRLEDIHFFHGVDLGLRYRAGNFGIESGVMYYTRSSKASGIDPDNGNSVQNEWTLPVLEYSLGVENFYGPFSLGASIGYKKLRYKNSIAGSNEKQQIFGDSQMATRIHVQWEFEGDNVSFAIRPWYSTLLDDYMISEVGERLNPGLNLPDDSYFENFSAFGISILFFNGP